MVVASVPTIRRRITCFCPTVAGGEGSSMGDDGLGGLLFSLDVAAVSCAGSRIVGRMEQVVGLEWNLTPMVASNPASG